MARGLFLAALAGVIALSSCVLSPQLNVTGVWRGPYGKFGAVYLVLEQHGDAITGYSCDFESGIRLHSGAPVAGTYPAMSSLIGAAHAGPCCAHRIGARLNLAVFDKREITGAWTFADGRVSTDVLDFRRADSAPAGCALQ